MIQFCFSYLNYVQDATGTIQKRQMKKKFCSTYVYTIYMCHLNFYNQSLCIKWHRSCYIKYNTNKVKRAEKGIRKKTLKLMVHLRKKLPEEACHVKPPLAHQHVSFELQNSAVAQLHQSSTFAIDQRVRECAIRLQDLALLAKLSAGDLVAQEVKYYTKCLVALYDRTSRMGTGITTETEWNKRAIHGVELAELISYIEDSRCEENVAPVFKMLELTKMYIDRTKKNWCWPMKNDYIAPD